MTVYRSKIDTWLLILLVFAMGLALGSALAAIAAGGAGMWLSVGPGVLAFGLILWVLLSTRYTLDGELLLVRSGPFRWRVPVGEITSITPTNNPLSSPALSLDRLRIEYSGGRRILISPKDKEAFIADIEAKMNAA